MSQPQPAGLPCRVLLVSYLLPPAGGVGVQRPLGYLRYLPACGCEVVALTCRNPAVPVYDPALNRLIPPHARIEKSWTFELPHRWRDRLWRILSRGRPQAAAANAPATLKPSGWRGVLSGWVERITAPDPQRAWLPLARRKALDLCAREKFDAVLVSVPPFSSLQIGVAVKRRYPHMSLISDFRDEWINYYLGELGPAPTPYRLKIAVEQERQAVEASDFVIAVTPQQRRLIRERHPREPEEKFITIFNGYDPDVFGRLDVRSHGGPRLRVAYIGTVYGHAIHSPGYWLEALDGLEEAERESLETRFVGRMEADAAPFLASARTPVSATGFLPQDKALNEMMQADALLLLVGDLNHVPAKLFEYMASGKPILCLTAPGGVAARLVEEARAGWTADLRNPAAVRALARKALEWKQTGCGFDPDKERIASFARPALVAQMARATGLEGS